MSKTSSKTKIVAVRLPESIYLKLKKRAEKDETTVSEVLRYFILKYIGLFEKSWDESEEGDDARR